MCLIWFLIFLLLLSWGDFVISVHQHHHHHHNQHQTRLWPSYKPRTYDTKFITLKVDHFSFTNSDTFTLRYLVNTDYWDRDKAGPIFFYTGNEGDITVFSNNTGFMWDLAPEFNAMLVFAEHRYYGHSKPYGSDCCKNVSRLGYLTSEQALADYAQLILHIIHSESEGRSLGDSPVISFGGSYGGMLSAWIRIKYPHIVHGSIASSAPVCQFTGLTPCNRFNQVTTRTFNVSSSSSPGHVWCPQAIRASWDTINKLGKTVSGRAQLASSLHLCPPGLQSLDDVSRLKDWLTDMYTSLAMVDYPYLTDFLAPLPAWPVKVACSYMSTDVITSISRVVTLFYNHTGQAGTCFNMSQSSTSSIGADLWGFQACTEMVMPMCSDGVSDMFEPRQWDLSRFVRECRDQWGNNIPPPQPHWVTTQYGITNSTTRGGALDGASNIIFTNGELDPWSSGGITKSISDSVISLLIPSGAHHLDLRLANANDPADVIKVRDIERKHIGKWIKQYHHHRANL